MPTEQRIKEMVSARLDASLLALTDALAQQQGTNRTAIIERALALYISQQGDISLDGAQLRPGQQRQRRRANMPPILNADSSQAEILDAIAHMAAERSSYRPMVHNL